MTTEFQRFIIFIGLTLTIFYGLLGFVLQQRTEYPSWVSKLAVATLVVVGGMLFAKLGQNAGWSWQIYYTVPAFLTFVLPPLVFQFSTRELWQYLILAFLTSPAIHLVFSFFLGWHEYMPFIRVPSLQELLTREQS
jgi:hypothetical protein